MYAERHAAAVRSYLGYLCQRPEIAESDGWRHWVRRTLGSGTGGSDWALRTLAVPATVGLSIGMLGSACTPEDGFEGGTGGRPTATGGVATGGVVQGTGGAYGLPTGGLPATGGVATGGRATGGLVGTGGKYGMPFGGSGPATGGRATGGTAGSGAMASGGAGGIGVRYGIPIAGMSG
jgi:hypothetical protein